MEFKDIETPLGKFDIHLYCHLAEEQKEYRSSSQGKPKDKFTITMISDSTVINGIDYEIRYSLEYRIKYCGPVKAWNDNTPENEEDYKAGWAWSNLYGKRGTNSFSSSYDTFTKGARKKIQTLNDFVDGFIKPIHLDDAKREAYTAAIVGMCSDINTKQAEILEIERTIDVYKDNRSNV